MPKSRCQIVIPARLASTRLPRKMLLCETGKPLIQHTWEGACQSTLAEGVCVATDDSEIFQTVSHFGGTAIMTSRNLCCGTERVAAVAEKMPGIDIFVNVQGDEPEITGANIDSVLSLLLEHADVEMATLAVPIRESEKLLDTACVKVVFDGNGHALYFSRSLIPYPRDGLNQALLDAESPLFYQHLGIYAYRRDFLLRFAKMERSSLEKAESLEQLRALENGISILVGVVKQGGIGIDTPEDYAQFVQRMAQKKQSG